MSSTAPRYEWLDTAKGLGIVLVVYGHVLRGMHDAKLLEDYETAFQWSDYTLYLFHMPLFFCLSGLTVPASLQKGRQRFLIDKIRSLAVPYFVWSIIQVAVQILASRATNHPTTVDALWTIWHTPPSPFWFLYALLICHVVAAILPSQKPSWWIIAIAAALLCWLFLYEVQQQQFDVESLLIKTAYHFAFYAVGFTLANLILRSAGSMIRLFVAAIVFGGIAWLNFTVAGWQTMTPLAVLAALSGSLCCIEAAKLLPGVLREFFAALGRLSLSIYVMHIIAGSGTRIILLKAGIENPAVHLVAGVVAGVALPCVAHLALQRLGLLPYFGLGNNAQKKPSDRKPALSPAGAEPEPNSAQNS